MLVISDEARPQLREAYEHAKRLGPQVVKQFLKQLLHCHRYGSYTEHGSDPEHRKNVRFTLYKDWAPFSFGFTVHRNDKFLFNGGLIYQGPDSPADGSGPSFTVSLTPGIGWYMHT